MVRHIVFEFPYAKQYVDYFHTLTFEHQLHMILKTLEKNKLDYLKANFTEFDFCSPLTRNRIERFTRDTKLPYNEHMNIFPHMRKPVERVTNSHS